MIQRQELFPPELNKFLFKRCIPQEKIRRKQHILMHGRHLSQTIGDSPEFHDYRPYAPGDDPRRIDWNLFRRTRKLLLRKSLHFPERKHLILLDDSPSIRFRPCRAVTAWRLAALTGGTLLACGDPVSLRVTGTAGDPVDFRPGDLSVPALLDRLSETFGSAPDKEAQKRGQQDLFSFRFPPRFQHVWIVSDFFDPEGFRHLEKALAAGSGFTPLRIFEKQERTPDFTKDFQLRDCENGKEIPVSADPGRMRRYQERLSLFERILENAAFKIGSRRYDFDAETPLPELMERFMEELFPEGEKVL